MKKVIKLTESELVRLVSKILSEDEKLSEKLPTIKTIKSNFPNAKTRNYKVISVKGRPSIKKGDKDLLLTVGMIIKPTDFLKFKHGDVVRISSISPEDMEKGRGKYFQQVELSFDDDDGKLELFVYSN
jgi:hypothetical protein